MKNMTKFRYNIRNALLTLVGGLLFLIVLFSIVIWFVSGSFLPLIISCIVFTSFAIFARIKYGLKFFEPLKDENRRKSLMHNNSSQSLSDAIYISNINHDTMYNDK